jgi:hypothetical protein
MNKWIRCFLIKSCDFHPCNDDSLNRLHQFIGSSQGPFKSHKRANPFNDQRKNGGDKKFMSLWTIFLLFSPDCGKVRLLDTKDKESNFYIIQFGIYSCYKMWTIYSNSNSFSFSFFLSYKISHEMWFQGQ